MMHDTAQAADQGIVHSRRLAGLIIGYQVSAAIGAFARLGVADALAAGPATGAELAVAVGADEGSLSRLPP
jgi:hypothetical protein